MSSTISRRILLSLALVGLVGLFPATGAQAVAPLYANAGANGLVGLPTDGTYVSPNDVHAYVQNGGQITAAMQAHHGLFGNPATLPGGPLDGVTEIYDSVLRFDIVGQGELEGVTSTVFVDANCVTHTSKQDPKADRRVLDAIMAKIEGSVKDHPDFAVFKVVAGDDFGLPSPGTLILTRQVDDIFLFESSFDINFQITLQGRRGSKWQGIEQVVTGKATMIATGEKFPRGDATQK